MGAKSLVLIFLNSSLMGLILLALRRYVTNLLSFILFALLGVICYLVVSYFNKVFSSDERTVLNNILPKPCFVF